MVICKRSDVVNPHHCSVFGGTVADLVKLLSADRPIMPLIVLRIGFGVLMLVSTLRFMAKGWIHAFYVVPQFHFTYVGFGWVKPLPESGLWGVFIVLAICSLGIAFGLLYRPSIITFSLLFSYIELLDKSYYLNHYYFVSVFSFILIFLPLNRAFSLDVRWGFTDKMTQVPAWCIWVARVQIAIVYFYAGLAKINPDWLFQAQPLTIWLRARTAIWGIGPLFDYRWVAFIMSWSGMLFDLTIPAWLIWKPSRKIAYGVVVIFHTMTAVLFNIGMFPWVMITVTLVFFDWNLHHANHSRRPRHSLLSGQKDGQANWLRRKAFGPISYAQRKQITAVGCTEPDETSCAIRKAKPVPFTPTKLVLGGGCKEPDVNLGEERQTTPAPFTPTKVILGLLLFSQLVIPLRHLANPGNVNWNEQGFRFAWRVMLVEKTGEVVYTVTDRATQQSSVVLPSDYLTIIQEKQMAFQPDMIVQFANFIDEQFEEDMQITADVNVSLNGRPSSRLIDPSADLTEVSIWNVGEIILPIQTTD